VLILLLFLPKYGRIFLQLSFCETNFTWRNDITCNNVLTRPICDGIHDSALSRVLYVTYFFPKLSKASKNTMFSIRFISKTSTSNYSKSLEKSERGEFLGSNGLKVISFGKQGTKETLETRIWNPATFGPWNPKSTAWNPESKALLDYLTWAEWLLQLKRKLKYCARNWERLERRLLSGVWIFHAGCSITKPVEYKQNRFDQLQR